MNVLEMITEENANDFDDAGVWALLGKKDASDTKWYCLQVAATKYIKNEILKDLQLLKHDLDESCIMVPYINQFKEKLFDYPLYPSPREYLYSKYLRETFTDFQFILVCREQDSTKRKEKEKAFAIATHAICWRNGRPYQQGEEHLHENAKSFSEKELQKILANFN